MVGMRRLQENDIEVVRQWRNSKHVRSQLMTQGLISQEQQKIWWEKVKDSATEQYFIFSDEDTKEDVGLVFLKNISTEEDEAEVGVFVGNTKYLNTGKCAFEAVEAINDIAFQIVSKIYCWIFDKNQAAIRFNEALGYQKTCTEKRLDTGLVRKYLLPKERAKKLSR